MPCYQVRTYTNELIVGSKMEIDRAALEQGAAETGLSLTTTSVGSKLKITDRETGREIAYLDGNTLTFQYGTEQSRAEDTRRIREAYSVGVVVNQASAKYWSPRVVKKHGHYSVECEVNY